MDAKELKPCPFCGGEPKMYYPFHLMGKPGHRATYHGGVRCSQCGGESKATTPVDGSISSWNARDGRVATGGHCVEDYPSGAASGDGWSMVHRAGKKAAGRLLDGRTHDGFPEAR